MHERIEIQFPCAKPNYTLAQEAFAHTLSVIEGSSTRLAREKANIDESHIAERINLMRQEPIHNEEYSLEWIQEIAHIALKYHVGNCCEQACTIFDYLCKKPNIDTVNIELFNNPFSDHFFIVIGRDPNTTPLDPREWNADTIICDPWIEDRSYYIGEINFQALQNNRREVISYLLSNTDPLEPLILAQDVLGRANGDRKSIIIHQPCMVLRTRLYEQRLVTYNQHIPVVYEAWDLPQEKHYKRQLARQHLFATNNPSAPPDEADSDNDLQNDMGF